MLAQAFVAHCEEFKVRVPCSVLQKLENAQEYPNILDLHKQAITKSGTKCLMDLFKMATPLAYQLTEIYLDFVEIGNHGATCLATLLRQPENNLTRLSLVHSGIGDEGGAAICQDLARLELIDLSDNKLGNETVTQLFQFFDHHKDAKLESLTLDRNPIGDKAGARLIRSLQGNRHLQSISLVRCNISFSTSAALLQLKCIRLSHVDIKHNSISFAKMKAIQQRFQLNHQKKNKTKNITQEAEVVQPKEQQENIQHENEEEKQEQEQELDSDTNILELIFKELNQNVNGDSIQANYQAQEISRLIDALQQYNINCANGEISRLVENVSNALLSSNKVIRRLQRTIAMYRTTSSKIVETNCQLNATIERLSQQCDESQDSSFDLVSLLKMMETMEHKLQQKQQQLDKLQLNNQQTIDDYEARIAQLEQQLVQREMHKNNDEEENVVL